MVTLCWWLGAGPASAFEAAGSVDKDRYFDVAANIFDPYRGNTTAELKTLLLRLATTAGSGVSCSCRC